ncbi:type III secretion system chaperone [uncultured Shewanella sp.]|uniref:type III secretion system chaperone n=1 Tax=uncultured Shewanella sp. TaxID=173975 RepID=UPI00261787A3|nr:type III secretion system chaperone [uncultured Shewanella sp.]
MINSLFNELGSQYGINMPVRDDSEAFTFKFENDIEIYVYLSKDKHTIHIFSTVQNINMNEDKLKVFEFLLKFQLMGVKSKNNSFGLNDDGDKIYMYRNFDTSTITSEIFVQGIKSLAISCEYAREQFQQLHMKAEVTEKRIPMNHFYSQV